MGVFVLHCRVGDRFERWLETCYCVLLPTAGALMDLTKGICGVSHGVYIILADPSVLHNRACNPPFQLIMILWECGASAGLCVGHDSQRWKPPDVESYAPLELPPAPHRRQSCVLQRRILPADLGPPADAGYSGHGGRTGMLERHTYVISRGLCSVKHIKQGEHGQKS